MTKLKKRYYKLIVIAVILLLYFIVRSYNHSFSTERWIAYPDKRVDMVDNLLNNFNLIDMTKEEIIELLGHETYTEYFKNDSNFVYYLGNERGLISIDSEWLVIEFDNGIVCDINIKTD